MKLLVTFSPTSQTYDFNIGNGLVMGIHEDELPHTLAVLCVIAWLSTLEWFTTAHLQELLALTKVKSPWHVWQTQQP